MDMNNRLFINMPIPADKFEAVCAVLAGVSSVALAAGNASRQPQRVLPEDNAKQDTAQSSAGVETPAPASPESAGTGPSATTDASPSNGEIDAHGHPWSADLHASTKGKTKDGLWRMKVGVTRPAPLPGFPTAESVAGTPDTGTSTGTEAPSATSPAATEAASAPAATSTDDEDEFAAFREAANKSDSVDNAAAAAATTTVREFSDADLGALCNQAAVKLGDPAPIKEIIAKYVPEGQVQHSRNIPADKRDAFAKEVEAKAGIEFAA
jgi:hypothetical protein